MSASLVLVCFGLFLSQIPGFEITAVLCLVPALLLCIVEFVKKKAETGWLTIVVGILSVVGLFHVVMPIVMPETHKQTHDEVHDQSQPDSKVKNIRKSVPRKIIPRTSTPSDRGKEVQKSAPRETEQVEIIGFGGYELGEKLDPNGFNDNDDYNFRMNGYVIRPAQKVFRNFKRIRLYLTPKTFTVYKILSYGVNFSEKDSNDLLLIVVASLEKKFKIKMKKFRTVNEFFFTRNHRTVSTATENWAEVWISFEDENLKRLNEREKEDIIQSKADTSGL